jgi:GxxExxY protein
MESNLPDAELTHKIIGCAMFVHRTLKNGFPEAVYQRTLEIEMRDSGIAFSREHEMPIHFKNELIGTRRVDFLVEGRISLELKAIIRLEDVHIAQALNYLEAYNIPIGLLINFGAKSLDFHRLFNKKFKLGSNEQSK